MLVGKCSILIFFSPLNLSISAFFKFDELVSIAIINLSPLARLLTVFLINSTTSSFLSSFADHFSESK